MKYTAPWLYFFTDGVFLYLMAAKLSIDGFDGEDPIDIPLMFTGDPDAESLRERTHEKLSAAALQISPNDEISFAA
jgi:hypothetical protein